MSWDPHPEAPERRARARTLARALGVSELLGRLLVARGLEDSGAARAFLEPGFEALHDPRTLPGIEAACARLRHAVERGERVLVHGDYDVDGVCGTVLLLHFLRVLGVEASAFIPDRVRDGYAFSQRSVDVARERAVQLVLSVDNGITSGEPIAALAAHGIDVVVTDHHEAGSTLPEAVALVNPKLPGSRYPFRDLCGVAVAFKLAWCLAERFTPRQRTSDELRAFLREAMAFVAIGTIADVMPLLDENRTLVHHGLRALRHTANPGLRALLASARVAPEDLRAEDVAFRLAPRLNAAGRVDDAARAVDLLTSPDEERAQELAAALETLNTRRRALDRALTEEVLARVEREGFAEDPALVLAGEGWPPGVLGIAAARVAERLGKPTVLIALDGDHGKGSGRTAGAVDLHAALASARDTLLQFGGHAHAAGLTIERAKVPALRDRLNEGLRGTVDGAPAARRPDLLVTLADLTPEVVRDLERVEPCGHGNERPVLVLRGARSIGMPSLRGARREHLTFRVHQGGRTIDAFLPGGARRADEFARTAFLDLLGTVRARRSRGRTTLEFVASDFRETTSEHFRGTDA